MEHVPTLAGRVVEALNPLTRGTLRPASERGEFFHERKLQFVWYSISLVTWEVGIPGLGTAKT